jgi:predicted O-linked N-acetylglucosamine transferase (SPINDLY family)
MNRDSAEHADAGAHSSMLALLHYQPLQDPGEHARAARVWGDLHAPSSPAAAPPVTLTAHPGQPLRVGYVSADFREHSVSYFFEPLLGAHDPARVSVTCYNNSAQSDAVTERLARHAHFVPIDGRSDTDVAAQIRSDGIHILVDLCGHTVGHRLPVFAHRAAPVQVTYLGYPGTTGVSAITHRLTDTCLDPTPDADAQYTERLVHLPRAFCCFKPPELTIEVSPLPAAANGFITFGSLNNYSKVSDLTLRVWGRVLRELPSSRMLLQSRVFGDAATRARIRARFERFNIDPTRVELVGALPLAEHLAVYHRIDIALDTLPWNGHTTTCLALHMGVPVLTLAGQPGSGRMGVSVLTNAGLADWIANDEEQYLALAVAWAREHAQLARLRAALRTRLASSALCDAVSFARDIEATYEQLTRA